MQRIVSVVGGTGFIGRHLVQALCREGYIVRVLCRDIVEGAFVKTFGQVGQVVLQHADVTNPETLKGALKGSFAVVNLVGILQPSGRQKFAAIHHSASALLAQQAKAEGAERFIQLSALGIEKVPESAYAASKKAGEDAVRAAFPAATILRPSLVIGPEDGFFQRFARMAMIAHTLPVLGSGKNLFQPVYVLDVVASILACLARAEVLGKTYELGGDARYSFREMLAMIGTTTHRNICLISIPMPIAKMQAFFFDLLPFEAPFTRDQLKLLKHHNIVSEGALTLRDLGVTPTAIAAVLPQLLARFMRQ